MTLPTTIRISGVDHSVTYETATTKLGRGLFGCIDHGSAEITVDGTLKEFMIRKVLLHELIHGVSQAFGADLTEEQTIAMENGLWQLFKDNPKLASELFA